MGRAFEARAWFFKGVAVRRFRVFFLGWMQDLGFLVVALLSSGGLRGSV